MSCIEKMIVLGIGIGVFSFLFGAWMMSRAAIKVIRKREEK